MPPLSVQDEKSASLEEGVEGVSLEEGERVGEGKVGGGQGSLGSFESVLLLLPPSPATPPLNSYTAADDDERSPGRFRRASQGFSGTALEEGAGVVGVGVEGIRGGGQEGGGEGGAAPTVVFPEDDAVALRDSSPFGSLLAPWRYWTRAAPSRHGGQERGDGEREGDEERGSEKREEVFGSCADFSAASGFMPIVGFKPKMNLLEVAIEKELEEKRRADEMNAPARLPTTGLLAVAARSEDAGSEEDPGLPTPLPVVVESGADHLPEERWTDEDAGLGRVGVPSRGGSRFPAARVTSPSVSPTSALQKPPPDSLREAVDHDFSQSPSAPGPSGLLPGESATVGGIGVEVVVSPPPPPLAPTLPTALSLSLSLSVSTPSPPPGSLSPASEAEDASRCSQSSPQSSAQASVPLFAPSMPPAMAPVISPAMPSVVSPAGSSIPSTPSEGGGVREEAAPPPLPSPELETLRQASPSPSSGRQDAAIGEAARSLTPEYCEQAEMKNLACPEATALPAAPVVSTHSPAPSPSPRGASMTDVGAAAPTAPPAPEGSLSIQSTPPTVVTATASPERKAPVRREKREREREHERERAPRNRAVAAAQGQVQAQAQAQAAWAPKPSAQLHAGKASGPARAQLARAPAWGMPLPLPNPEPHPALRGLSCRPCKCLRFV